MAPSACACALAELLGVELDSIDTSSFAARKLKQSVLDDADLTRRLGIACEQGHAELVRLRTQLLSEKPAMATRKASERALNTVNAVLPETVGGSADLTPSNLTKFRGALDFQMATPEGRYVRFGVRERRVTHDSAL